MKKLILAVLFAALAVPSTAQDDVATIYKMSPMLGHGSELEDALAEHSAWRTENDDPWEWNMYQVISGDNVGTFYVRSGGHTWSDFDEYSLEGSEDHFEETVAGHLELNSNMVTVGDTTNFNWPEWGNEAPYYWRVEYDLHVGEFETFKKAVELFHEAVSETDHPSYYYVATVISGGGDTDVEVVVPLQSLSDLARDEEGSVDAMLKEFYKEVGKDAVDEMFSKSIRDSSAEIIAARPDLSVN